MAKSNQHKNYSYLEEFSVVAFKGFGDMPCLTVLDNNGKNVHYYINGDEALDLMSCLVPDSVERLKKLKGQKIQIHATYKTVTTFDSIVSHLFFDEGSTFTDLEADRIFNRLYGDSYRPVDIEPGHKVDYLTMQMSLMLSLAATSAPESSIGYLMKLKQYLDLKIIETHREIRERG